MAKVEVNQAQENFPELLAFVDANQERIVIESEGKLVAAVISYADLKRLEALEEANDIEDYKHALAESNDESYSVEEVIADYNKIHGTNFTRQSILND